MTTRVPCLFVHFVTLFWETIGSYNRAEKVLINLAAATKWYRLSPIRTDLPHKLPEIDTNCIFYPQVQTLSAKRLCYQVIKWFDYLWLTQKSSDEERSINCLPGKEDYINPYLKK